MASQPAGYCSGVYTLAASMNLYTFPPHQPSSPSAKAAVAVMVTGMTRMPTR